MYNLKKCSVEIGFCWDGIVLDNISIDHCIELFQKIHEYKHYSLQLAAFEKFYNNIKKLSPKLRKKMFDYSISVSIYSSIDVETLSILFEGNYYD